MVNLSNVSAIAAEPVATASPQPARGRIESGGPGTFAKLLTHDDGGSADSSATDRDDPTDDATGTDAGLPADPAMTTPLDPALAGVPTDKLTVAMNEGVGAVLALLAAMPAPAPPAMSVASAPAASDGTTAAIAAASSAKTVYMPVIAGRGAMAPGMTAAISMPAPSGTAVAGDLPLPSTPMAGTPDSILQEAGPAPTSTAAPAPRQDVPAMLTMLRKAFAATAVTESTATATADPASPAVDAASAIPVVPSPATTALPVMTDIAPPPAAPAPATDSPAATVPLQPQSPTPDMSPADPAPDIPSVPTDAASVSANTPFAIDMPRAAALPLAMPAPVVPNAEIVVPVAQAIVASAPTKNESAPDMPLPVEPADGAPVLPFARPQATTAPFIPTNIQPAQIAAAVPEPVALRKKDEDKSLAIDGTTVDGTPIVAPSTPITAASSTDAGAAADVQPSQSQQSIARHLDLARDSQWLDRLAQDISQAATRNGHLKFQLNPEHLGSLQVEITNGAAGTSVRMTADTDTARAIIADAQPRLVAEARAQGLRISETHVDLGSQAGSGGAGGRQPSSEDHKPFVRTQAATRAEINDSPARSDDERYA